MRTTPRCCRHTSRRFLLGIAALVAGLSFLDATGVGPDRITRAADESRSDSDNDRRDDFEKLQGTWEREVRPEEKVPYKRVVKIVAGNRENVTYYKEDGSVWRAHQVQFRLDRHGPVKVFTFFDMEVTDGPDKGQKVAAENSYVYRVTEKTFDEVWGFLPGQEARPITYHVHRKVNNPGAVAGKEKGKEKPVEGEAVPAAGREK